MFTLFDEQDETTREMQIALNKQGTISGTLCNTTADATPPIVVRSTSRSGAPAVTPAARTNAVAETGISNLTQDQTSILLHLGKERAEEYLLVRLTREHRPQ